MMDAKILTASEVEAIENCDRKCEHVVACVCEIYDDCNSGHPYMADTMTEAVRNLKSEK